ncbi:MAG TPA: DUF4249 domain-containing protein, partial [Mucilaginibacter sp.]|nr:DUF4249 domain-containing protein [Mucilaginibacter sp.]
PPVVTTNSNYLVVEGVINTGSDSTVFKISRTVNLSSKITANPVLNAIVSVESDQNGSYSLIENSDGFYAAAGLNLDNTHKYRLRITTAGEVYLSDFVPVLNSPAIDTVSYSIQGNGIQFYVSSHDPNNNTHYYRWDYQETWVIHSAYYSFYKSNGDVVIDRNFINDEVYQCWRSDTSSTINVASSTQLKQDVISNKPITFISSASEKLMGKYSIIISQHDPSTTAYSMLVKQYALTADAYSFWSNLKTTTEQLGSIFDAEPTQIKGNIHSTTHPSEPVIGYLSAGVVTSKRIFIKNQQIPDTWASSYSDCKIDTLLLSYLAPGSTVPVNQENEYFNYNNVAIFKEKLIPVAGIFNKITGAIVGHTGSTPECVDCTLRGTNKQPLFWR